MKFIKIPSIVAVSILLSSAVFADLTLPVVNTGVYSNIREGNSRYINKLNSTEVFNTYNDVYKLGILREIINNSKINSCASKIITNMKDALKTDSNDELKNAVLSLRLDNAIDDVVVGLLFRSIELNPEMSLPKKAEELSADDEAAAIKIYTNSVKEIKNVNNCPEDSYRSLYYSVTRHSNLFARQFKRLNKFAYKNNILSKDEFEQVENLRMRKVHQWPSTLLDYKTTLESLKTAFPNRIKEETIFVTDTKFGQGKSLRQSLHERFNTTQIILISEVMKNLRKRLDSQSVTISINYENADSEVINLSPMEKFRFIIKMMRKEMAVLNNSNLLGGQRVTYSDVIAASYEVGYINSSEIETLASLEDIWNPKKTKKEKAMFWGKTFGEVASVILPPPYGFLSLMVIMIIDQQIADPKADPNADYNLI